jgi:hypothetical protein
MIVFGYPLQAEGIVQIQLLTRVVVIARVILATEMETAFGTVRVVMSWLEILLVWAILPGRNVRRGENVSGI